MVVVDLTQLISVLDEVLLTGDGFPEYHRRRFVPRLVGYIKGRDPGVGNNVRRVLREGGGSDQSHRHVCVESPPQQHRAQEDRVVFNAATLLREQS